MKLYIVDAFTDKAFGGNPAGVVVLPEKSDFPKEHIMQKIATELRYSETAFIKQLTDSTFNIRYFTPVAEVDLCGHATIASFYVLLKAGIVKAGSSYQNQTLAGNLDIFVDVDSILMDMAEPQLFDEIAVGEATEKLYQVMGLSSAEQGTTKVRQLTFFARKVSTGLVDIMLPVKSQAELDNIAPDFKALSQLSRQYDVVGVHAFTANTDDGKVHARNFAPLYDIDEEAATGTSNGALAYYLYSYGYLKQDQILEVIQGEKMGRPSQIMAQVIVEDGKERVKVGGRAVILAKGELDESIF